MISAGVASRTESSRASRLWRGPVLVRCGAVLVAALVYVVAAYGYGKPFGAEGEPSFLIRAGSDFATAESLPAGTHVTRGSGYDGQFFFYIAQDPLLLGDTESQLDNPEYRSRRILLPLLGWVTSAGEPEVLQWTLPLVNIAAILISGFVLAGFLQRRGLSGWLSLLYMLSLGLMAPALNDVSDPLAAGLFVLGLLWWAEDRTTPALVALGAAPFAREVFLIPLLAVAAIELYKWRGAALVWLVPPGAFLVWTAYLGIAYGEASGDTPVATPSVVPLAGAIEKFERVLREDVVGAANWEVAFITLSLCIWALLAVRSTAIVLALRRSGRWPARQDLVPAIGLLAILSVPFMTVELWSNPLSYVRYTAPTAAILLAVYAAGRDRWALWLVVALFAVSLANPVIPYLPMNHGPLLVPT